MRIVGALLLCLLLTQAVAADEARPTVVSLDYCADQFVLGLADREQILAVSKDAGKAFSHLRANAKGLRQVRTASEDVIALQPDLVIRSWGGDARAMAMYQRFGIAVYQIGYGADFDTAARETLSVGQAMGQGARAQTLVAAMPGASIPKNQSALYITPGGLTAGEATMVGAIMAHAGLSNAGGAGSWTPLPMEVLLLDPPTLALTAFFNFDADAADAWSIARHPLMRRVLTEADTYALDESRLTCPAWFVADEAQALAEALPR